MLNRFDQTVPKQFIPYHLLSITLRKHFQKQTSENSSKNTLQEPPDLGQKFPHLLTKMGSKTLVPPSLTTKNRVKTRQILSNHDKQYQRFLDRVGGSD